MNYQKDLEKCKVETPHLHEGLVGCEPWMLN
jgi:hypothetical protein